MVNPSGKAVLDLLYIKLLHMCLFLFGGWPNFKENKYQSPLNAHVIHLVIQGLVIIGQIIYLHDHIGKNEFKGARDALITTFITFLATVRLSLPHFRTYFDIFRTYVQDFHLIYFKHKGTSYRKVFSTMEKVSRYYTIFMITIAFLGFFLFNSSPLYINITNGAFNSNRYELQNLTLEFTVKYKFPGYTQEENIITSIFINLYLSFMCSLSVIAIDLLFILMTFQIIGHLQILEMNMTSMPKPKMIHLKEDINDKHNNAYAIEMYDEEENMVIKQLLTELIEHHKLIISFTDKISNFFSPMLGFNYLFHLVACCLLLLECSRGNPDVIVRYGPLTLVIFIQLIQVSVVFEIVTHKSSLLINSVYYLPWECMNTQNRRTVSIMLLRMQTPIRVTAFGSADVGVKTMTNILKTTFSYYTFLRSL